MKPVGANLGMNGMQALFLCSLFLYPFNSAEHTLYLVPQVLLLALGILLVPHDGAGESFLWKHSVSALGLCAVTLAFVRECLAGSPAFLEPTKLALNILTLLLFLFLVPVFDPVVCATWLKRFSFIWLSVMIAAYVHAGTSTWQMAGLLFEPEGVTSTRLYELADPLMSVFLTKNILAMYFVAIFGCFLYFRRSAGLRVALWESVLFVLPVLFCFSRQAFLALVVIFAIDYFLGTGHKKHKWTIVLLLIIGVIVGLFLTFAFNFTSYADGATTRLELWRVFFARWDRFCFLGLGVHDLNLSLDFLDIDNYHMFFMNQIAAYGIIHCIAFNLLLTILTVHTLPKRTRWLLIAPFWLNVCFQTYGYEYGNLFLYCIAASSANMPAPDVCRLFGFSVAPVEGR